MHKQSSVFWTNWNKVLHIIIKALKTVTAPFTIEIHEKGLTHTMFNVFVLF